MSHVMVIDSDISRPAREFGLEADAVESVQSSKTRKSLTLRMMSGARHSVDAASGRMLLGRLGYTPAQIEQLLPRDKGETPKIHAAAARDIAADSIAFEPVVSLPPIERFDPRTDTEVTGHAWEGRRCTTCWAYRHLSSGIEPCPGATQKIPCGESARTNADIVDQILPLL